MEVDADAVEDDDAGAQGVAPSTAARQPKGRPPPAPK